MTRRILSLLLAALMLLPLAACAADGKPADTSAAEAETTAPAPESAAETEAPKPSDNLPETSLDGYEFRVLSSDTSGYCLNFPEEQDGELLNDALFERNSALQERFNFTLSITSEPTDNGFVGKSLKNASAAGDNSYQLYLPYTKTLIDYTANILPFNDIPYVDYTQPWWFPDATQAFNIGGYQLALSGCFDLCIPSQVQCLAFNKNMLAELNLSEDIYTLVRDGRWTLDKFVEIGLAAVKDLNGDGVMDENDRTALASHWKGFASFFLNGFGVSFATKDEEGYPVFSGASDEKLVNAIGTLQGVVTNNPGFYLNKATNNYSTIGSPAFADAGTLFNSANLSMWLSTYRDIEFDIGMCPPPKADEEQTRYYCQTAYGHSPVLCRSLPKDEWEKVGLLIEAFGFSTYYDLFPAYKEVALKNKAAASPDESEMIDRIWDSIFYDFGVLCWESTVADTIVSAFFVSKSTAVVSFLTKMAPGISKQEKALRKAIEGLAQ